MRKKLGGKPWAIVSDVKLERMSVVAGRQANRPGAVDRCVFDEVPEHVINTALKASNLIGDGLYGVDIKAINGKCYVIEINDNPTIESGCEDAILKMELYSIVMKVFRDRIERKKKRIHA